MTGSQLLTIALAGAVTYLIRASFLAYADRMVELPYRVRTVLRMIPPAALAALVLPSLLRPSVEGLAGAPPYDLLNPVLVGGVVAALVSRWKQNIGLSLAAGLVAVVAVRPFLG